MWIAKKDFLLRGVSKKKGEEVRVSSSIAAKLEAEDKIEKARDTKKSKDSDK